MGRAVGSDGRQCVAGNRAPSWIKEEEELGHRTCYNVKAGWPKQLFASYKPSREVSL